MGPPAVSLPCRASQPCNCRYTIGHPVRTRGQLPTHSSQNFPCDFQLDCNPSSSPRAVIQNRAAPHRISIGLERLKINSFLTAPHCIASCRSLPLWATREVFDTPPEDGRLAIQGASFMTSVTTQFGQRHHTAHQPAPLSRDHAPNSSLFSTSPPTQPPWHAPTELPSSTIEARAPCLPPYGPLRARASSTWPPPAPTPSQSPPRRDRKQKTVTPAATRRAITNDPRAPRATTTTSPMEPTSPTSRKPETGRGSRR